MNAATPAGARFARPTRARPSPVSGVPDAPPASEAAPVSRPSTTNS